MNRNGVAVALGGLAVISVGALGWQGRLPRNVVAGVRTPATMRSDEAFLLANKAAAPLEIAGGAVMVAGGVLAASLPVRASKTAVRVTTVVAVTLLVTSAVQGARAVAR